MICPLRKDKCYQGECAWWCDGEWCCAIKGIYLELIKLEEKK